MSRFLISTLLAAIIALTACSGGDDQALDPSLIHEVERIDLRITIREQGEMQASTNKRVRSEIEGQATINFLIPEGSVVKKGQLIAKLDVSEIEERRANQAIQVAKAKAALDQAEKNLEILDKQLRVQENNAASRLEIAEMRKAKFIGQAKPLPADLAVPDGIDAGKAGTNREMLDSLRGLIENERKNDPAVVVKYSGLVVRTVGLLGKAALQYEMGEMANQILQQIDKIGLARADLELARENLMFSEQLAERTYISRNELERDRITFRRQLSAVTVAWNDLQLLINYTHPEKLIELDQEIMNARLNLESVRAENEARRVRENADLDSARTEYELARDRLENWERQIENAVIHAPTPGLIVYAAEDRRGRNRIEEGDEVRESQTVLILPDITTMVANLTVHEAQINKVALGQQASIRIDAFPNQIFSGRVSRVSSLPDSSSRWSNPDLKVYRTTVELAHDNSDGLIRPGMNATVEINVGIREDVICIPLTALQRSGKQNYVWKLTDSGPAPMMVEVGSNNLTHVEIVAGLEAGERIFLVQPPGAQPPAAAEEAGRLPSPANGTSEQVDGELDAPPRREQRVPVPKATDTGGGSANVGSTEPPAGSTHDGD